MDLTNVSVFVKDDPLTGGNPLAVFKGAEGVAARRMQAVAQTLNLSESSFVTRAERDSYDVRIFTPHQELPFAGHPTIGTAWVLKRAGQISGGELTQHSPAGPTPIREEGGLMWFTRTGSSDEDLDARRPDATRRIAAALRVDERDIGLEAREFGRSGELRPAIANAGFDQLMVPLRDEEALGRCRPDAALLSQVAQSGMYCFTGAGAGKLRARGFFAPVGVEEDAATGSAAAALGLYLGHRLEPIEIQIEQGVEMGRPSILHVKAAAGRVQVGGRCELVYTGRLEASL